ncbi:hypothetical protein ACFOHY_25660 [Rhizobium rosettiformans]|uniref:hypothetical protein n=1 Tax=Rhizobium rosettiformans TaxID=1368430 RepID=UPI00361A331E
MSVVVMVEMKGVVVGLLNSPAQFSGALLLETVEVRDRIIKRNQTGRDRRPACADVP